MRAIAEAPSKVIITGEHFVVHGAWALAAALPRRVRVEVEPAPGYGVNSNKFRANSPELRPVKCLVEAISREFSISPNVSISITSGVPEGAGLGSSASTMVAVTAALSRLHSLGLGVDEIARVSMVGEQEVHGRPSGIDPAICARGGVILFRPGTRTKRVSFVGSRSLIVSFSGINRSTGRQIGKVSQMQERFPRLFSMLAASISRLSLDAADRMVEGDMGGLGGLLTIDHAALGSVGVSNETLNRMVDLLVSMGAYGAKLTGAGGGGSVIAVAPEAKEKSIVSGLSARGFETFSARIPTEGVKSWLER